MKADDRAARDPTTPLAQKTTELLTRVRAGDDRAREALLRRYLPRLRAWAHGRLPRTARDLSDTDDLVQFALVQSFLHLEGFEPRHEGAFLAYVRQILRNKIKDEARRARNQEGREPLAESMESGGPSPLEDLLGRDLLDAYETALEKLTDGQREAVILRVELGYNYREIAEAIESSSADAARMLVVRGLERLGEELDAHRS